MSVDDTAGVAFAASGAAWELRLTEDLRKWHDEHSWSHAGYTVRLVNQDDPKENVHSCGLTKDEALGQLASWLFTGRFLFTVKDDTDTEHVCWKNRT